MDNEILQLDKEDLIEILHHYQVDNGEEALHPIATKKEIIAEIDKYKNKKVKRVFGRAITIIPSIYNYEKETTKS